MAVTPPAAGSADPAVQLTTLPGWRQFVAAVPSVPALLPEQDWLSLEDGKRASHDEERLEHHSRLVVVQTPVIGRIVKRGGDLIRMNRLAHYGRSGLMVSGPARTGKTTAVTQLGKTAELMHRQRNRRSVAVGQYRIRTANGRKSPSETEGLAGSLVGVPASAGLVSSAG